MRRRALLAALPAVTALPGCLGGSNPQDTDSPEPDPTTPSSTPSQSPTPDPDPVDVTFSAALRYFHSDDAVGITAPDRDQFAFLSTPVVGDGDAPPPDSFALDLDGARYEPRSSTPGFQLSTPGIDEAYTTESRSGSLVFDVPTVEGDGGALLRDGERHPIAEDDLPRFASAPDLTVLSVDTPESTTPGGTFDVTAEVTNEGDADGTFLAGVWGNGLLETLSARVPAGATETARVTLDVRAEAGGAELWWFAHPNGSEKVKVPVEANTETSDRTGTETPSAD